MRLGLVASLLFLAAAVAATGHAAPASPPGKLWAEYPLEPRVETPRAAPSPKPAPRAAAEVTESEPPTRWLLLALGAAAAMAAVSTVGGLGVPIVRSRQEGGASARPPAARAVPAATAVTPMEVAAHGVQPEPPERPEPPGPSLVEVLSPHARLREPEQDDAETRVEACEIAWWRGYVKSQFYIQADSSFDEMFESPFFRARARGGEAPVQAGPAAEAHQALVDDLTAAGWEPEGRGEQWFSERFRRERSYRLNWSSCHDGTGASSSNARPPRGSA